MRKVYFNLVILSILTQMFFCQCSPDSSDSLWNKFCNPSKEARTKVWWFHGETITTKEGIDADLQAFKDAGIGGVVFYDQTHGTQEGAFPSMSPEWWSMLKYAAQKAKELDLSFEMAATNGYVAGGPWIKPEMGMKKVVGLLPYESVPNGFVEIATVKLPVSEDEVYVMQEKRETLTDDAPLIIHFDAGKSIEVRTISYMVTPRGKGSFGSMNIPGKPQERYFGAGYIDMPPIGELECSVDGKDWKLVTELQGVEDIIGHKSRQRTINFHPVTARYFRMNIHDWIGEASKYTKLEVDNVRLLGFDMLDNWETKSGIRSEVTYKKYKPEGSLNGVITSSPKNNAGMTLRIGYVPTGGQAKHGRVNIVYEGEVLTAKTWLEADILDSRAAELQYNSYFKQVYDTLAAIGCPPQGLHMDSHEAGIANWTERMPEHFSRICGYDIVPWLPALCGYIVESYDATEKFLHDFRRAIDQTISSEFYATFHRLCERDGVKYTSQAMLGAVNDNIASRGQTDKPQGEFWGYQVNGNYDCLDSSSSAHLYGKKISSAEAFTDTQYFVEEGATEQECIEGWHTLMRIGNLAYCKGVNEFVVCASSYQPWLDHKYDDSASAHPYIFHRLNPAWSVSREHFWEYHARCSELLQQGRPVVDLLIYIGEDAPLKTMAYKLPIIPEGYSFDVATLRSLKEANWESPYIPQYKAIVVEDRIEVSEEAESLLVELQQKGIKVIRCDKGERVADRLDSFGIVPDINIKSNDDAADKVYFCHRATDDADIYFVYNHSPQTYCQKVDLRAKGKNPELWNAYTLERKAFTGELSLGAYESTFIILNH